MVFHCNLLLIFKQELLHKNPFNVTVRSIKSRGFLLMTQAIVKDSRLNVLYSAHVVLCPKRILICGSRARGGQNFDGKRHESVTEGGLGDFERHVIYGRSLNGISDCNSMSSQLSNDVSHACVRFPVMVLRRKM